MSFTQDDIVQALEGGPRTEGELIDHFCELDPEEPRREIDKKVRYEVLRLQRQGQVSTVSIGPNNRLHSLLATTA